MSAVALSSLRTALTRELREACGNLFCPLKDGATQRGPLDGSKYEMHHEMLWRLSGAGWAGAAPRQQRLGTNHNFDLRNDNIGLLYPYFRPENPLVSGCSIAGHVASMARRIITH